jgi:hypothetical protein
MNKYKFVVRLCEGHSCGTIEIEAENEDIAQDMALNYVCNKLADALPELDIDVSVTLEDEYWNV